MSGDPYNVTTDDESDVEALKAALFGRSVVRVERPEPGERLGWAGDVHGKVYLDDGTVLRLNANEGGCSCGAGDYILERLNAMPVNGITNVQVKVTYPADDDWESPTVYQVFVIGFDGGEHELAAFEGDDGNGYYGTGFWFDIVRPEPAS